MVKRRKKEEERKTRWMNLRGITCNFKQVQKKRNQIGHRKIRSGVEPGAFRYCTLYSALDLDVCHEQEQDRKGKPFSIKSGL